MNDIINDPVSFLFKLICITFIIFLLIREFWCWYWKINKTIQILKNIDESLINIDESLQLQIGVQNKNVQHESWECSKCGVLNTEASNRCVCGKRYNKT